MLGALITSISDLCFDDHEGLALRRQKRSESSFEMKPRRKTIRVEHNSFKATTEGRRPIQQNVQII